MRNESKGPRRLKTYAVAAVAGWTLCVAIIFLWDMRALKGQVLELARIEARTAFFKDLIFRRWNASHGGVYVPADEDTEPNPYLNSPDKDVVTTSGLKLTLVNPAFMTRQVHELQEDHKGILGHITSLKPIRPKNAPDEWERKALEGFEGKLGEVSALDTIDGEEYMRLMRPLITEKQCLQCHAVQGYKEGDIRGGISVSIPMEPFWTVYGQRLRGQAISMWMVWLLGTIMIMLGFSKISSEAGKILKSEKTIRAITDTASDTIIMTDVDGRVMFWNQAGEEMFGYTAPETLGEPIGEFITDLRGEPVGMSVFYDIAEMESRTTQIRLLCSRKDGGTFPAEASVGTVELDDGHHFVCVMRDITERLHNEEELGRAREEAETASRAKSEFLANLSHEIRTPMNGIIGMTDLALETNLSLEQKEYLETIQHSADSLHGLLNDILDLSKIEAGKLELERIDFNLRQLLESISHVFSVQAHRKNIELNCHIPPETPIYLQGDPGRLRQVVVNLLGNAVKFTEKGEITLKVEGPFTPPEGDEEHDISLRFTVSDTGIGIPPDKIKNVFESFKQADSSTTRKYGGTGLGLAISKQLVELMGGSIDVSSDVGVGSAFHFSARFALGQEVADSGKSTFDLTNLKVLIVDDNVTNRFILNEMLTGWGAVPVEADEALIAISKLKRAIQEQDPIELVLLDYQMPRIDGIELARMIKKDPKLQDTSIIMLTSAALKGDMERARKTGVERFLHKPVKQVDLLACIMAVSGRHRNMEGVMEDDELADSVIPQTAYRVLIVEDNAINRKLVVRVLEKKGHQVRTAFNGREAIERLEEEDFDLVLMDIQMPGMDGIEATRYIRTSDGANFDPEIPIIAITARAMRGDMEECFEAGMDGYLAKPIRATEIIRVINDIMEQKA